MTLNLHTRPSITGPDVRDHGSLEFSKARVVILICDNRFNVNGTFVVPLSFIVVIASHTASHETLLIIYRILAIESTVVLESEVVAFCLVNGDAGDITRKGPDNLTERQSNA